MFWNLNFAQKCLVKFLCCHFFDKRRRLKKSCLFDLLVFVKVDCIYLNFCFSYIVRSLRNSMPNEQVVFPWLEILNRAERSVPADHYEFFNCSRNNSVRMFAVNPILWICTMSEVTERISSTQFTFVFINILISLTHWDFCENLLM